MVSRNELTTTKRIQQRTGKNFHVATRVLPRRVRHGTYVLYAFFREADEIVDNPDPDPPAVQQAALDRIETAVLGDEVPADPVLSAFQEVKERNAIEDREVEAFLDAMRMDVHRSRYETHEQLQSYLRGSSVAVGHMMTSLMDPDDPETARPHAKALGEAFQITNFLRDVREDVLEYDRIYLPREALDQHGVDHQTVADLECSPAFADAMRAELERTEQLYDEGVAGIEYLPEDCQFGVLLAAVLYADHHRLIRRQGYDVLSEQPSLTTTRRVALAAATWWHWRWTRDPVQTFYSVSAVDPPDERPPLDERPSLDEQPPPNEREAGHRSPGGCQRVSRSIRTITRSLRTIAGAVRGRS